MITKGIDIAAKGMMALIEFNDLIANNLANVNTTGFKKSNLTFRSVYDAAIGDKSDVNNPKYSDYRKLGELSMGPVSHKLLVEFEQGNIERTGNTLDLAIQGDGFFKIQDPDGKITYTRNGNFTINNRDMLVTKEGDYVLDHLNKRIRISASELNNDIKKNLIINEDGQISVNGRNDSTTLQRIHIVDFVVKSDLMSLGNSRFLPRTPSANPPITAEKFKLQQGAIEGANSNTVSEMINIINVSRNYETLSKYVKTNGDLLSRAINLGRLS